jgi:hypothetical protein
LKKALMYLIQRIRYYYHILLLDHVLITILSDPIKSVRCPIAALLTDDLILYFDIIGYFGERSP